jgi:prepilin-type processing-associated H-X9-DG protein
VLLLPYIEQEALGGKYDWTVTFTDAKNHAVTRQPLRIYQCPSCPRMDRVSAAQRACSDYAAMSIVNIPLRSRNLGLIDPVQVWHGVMPGVSTGPQLNLPVRMNEILDGTSHTLCVVEDAIRPEHWRKGRMVVPSTPVAGAAWADQENNIGLDGFSDDGVTTPGPCAINCTNREEVYSFHPGGANMVCADGSVRFLKQEINIRVMARLVTRAGGEPVGADF